MERGEIMATDPKNNIIVVCGTCGNPAKYDWPTAEHPYGVYHWDEPCKCGAQNWIAHEVGRDWLTGRMKPDNK